jgi:hypothetical protein
MLKSECSEEEFRVAGSRDAGPSPGSPDGPGDSKGLASGELADGLRPALAQWSPLFPFLFFLALAALVPGAAPAQAQSMVNQNLFTADRKPPAPPKAAAAKRQNIEEVRRAKVLGIVAMGEDRAALMEAPGTTFELGTRDAQVIKVWVREKEKVGEFEVEKIDPDKVHLRRGEETVVLQDRTRGKRLGRESKPFAPAK